MDLLLACSGVRDCPVTETRASAAGLRPGNDKEGLAKSKFDGLLSPSLCLCGWSCPKSMHPLWMPYAGSAVSTSFTQYDVP